MLIITLIFTFSVIIILLILAKMHFDYIENLTDRVKAHSKQSELLRSRIDYYKAKAEEYAVKAKVGKKVTGEVPGVITLKQFAYIKEMSKKDNKYYLKTDFAQFLTGEEGKKAAEKDGKLGPDGILENDYYIKNSIKRLRTHLISKKVKITLKTYKLEETGDPSGKKFTIAQFNDILSKGDDESRRMKDVPYWLKISGDTIVDISEQYLP